MSFLGSLVGNQVAQIDPISQFHPRWYGFQR
jgi:hypothetical protein